MDNDYSGDSIQWRDRHPTNVRAASTKMEFAKHEDAVRKAADLKSRGMNAYVERTPKGRFRVRLGAINK